LLVNRSFTSTAKPASLYYSNNDIDTKGHTAWCVAFFEKATVTVLVNVLTDFAKHRIVVHCRVPRGSDRFSDPVSF